MGTDERRVISGWKKKSKKLVPECSSSARELAD